MTSAVDSTDSHDEAHERQFVCLYFGFASNLSPRTLQQRCPGALYVGLARLKGWRFIVSQVGFGNIVPGDSDDEVYGSLHFLTRQHESALDKSEEVPWWHQKKQFKVSRLEVDGGKNLVDAGEVDIMTYVDIERTTEGVISEEDIPSLRKAVGDGLQCGVPQAYLSILISIGRSSCLKMLLLEQRARPSCSEQRK